MYLGGSEGKKYNLKVAHTHNRLKYEVVTPRFLIYYYAFLSRLLSALTCTKMVNLGDIFLRNCAVYFHFLFVGKLKKAIRRAPPLKS